MRLSYYCPNCTILQNCEVNLMRISPKGTAELVLEVALDEVGTIEGPADNETKYGAYCNANFLPWCGSFVNWVFNEAGVKLPSMVSTANGATRLKNIGRWVLDGPPKPGDLCFMDFPHDNVDRISHIGIVLKVEKNQVQVIEGNTSESGSQRNGGMVMLKWREYVKPGNPVVGFGRPRFVSLLKPAKVGIDQ